MRVLSESPEQLKALEYIYLGDSPEDPRPQRLALEGVRFNKAYALLSFDGYKNRGAADLLRQKVVMIEFDQAAPLADGRYYLFQLIGLRVIADGIEVGHVKEVLQTGANDVYVVEGEQFGEILIPAHEETVEKIDFETEVITMTLPDGLLPEEQTRD